MKTIHDAFILPSPDDIRAMGFVIRLRDQTPEAETRRMVKDYVVTPTVEREIPLVLDKMKQVFDRGEDYGRFIHGSFGSGKSHFMTMLSLLLESTASTWDKFRPMVRKYIVAEEKKGRQVADPEIWLQQANLLVVRLQMLSARGRATSLDRLVYDAFNEALKKRGKLPFAFLNLDGILDEVRREAEEYGDIVWKNLEAAGIIGGREDFEAIVKGSANAREDFVREWLKYKKRDEDQAGVDPRWTEGLLRMASHAKANGYGGIVIMIDEFLLWLAEKSGIDFIREINNLNVVVDHNTGQRAVPVYVFVARQRNLQDFFPDLTDETRIHEQIGHHSQRFEETKLEDMELRHIVKGRVLEPKDPVALAKAMASLFEKQEKIIPALLSSNDRDYLRDVYPFHPALIEMLVDATSLMQRERSALRLLYELLVNNPNLPLGEFLPVGAAFESLFPEAGVEATKKIELMQDIHRQYYQRLRPAIQRMAADSQYGFTEERQRALDQFVKTVLLSEVSPRLRQQGLTIERIVHLNSVDVEGESFRGKTRVAEDDLLKLSQLVPDLQVAGEGKTAIVRFVLGRVSLGEILQRALSKVDNTNQRFKVFYGALKKAMEIDELRGFEDGNEGDWQLLWRKTPRTGRLKLGNVREMNHDDFTPEKGKFALLVDYPWDEPGHTVEEDRLRAENARKNKGNQFTACWLPRHMTRWELDVVTQLAAVRYLLSGPGQEDLLETYAPNDKSKILDEALSREHQLQGQLDTLLKDIYQEHGQVYALIGDVTVTLETNKSLAENLKRIATALMDRQYPQHPQFGAEPKRQDLEQLLQWMVNAGEVNTSIAYDEETGRVLKTLGTPLELVNQGQTKASLRLDTRYIKEVMQAADQDSVKWSTVSETLRDNFGFSPILTDLFLCFLCKRDHRALRDDTTNDAIDVKIGMGNGIPIRLQRGRVLTPAEWSRVRELGTQLFGMQPPGVHRSLQQQDRHVATLKEFGLKKRLALQNIHERLVSLGISGGDRLQELNEANHRLTPLARNSTDSHAVLTDLLAAWPETSGDPLLTVIHKIDLQQAALGNIDDDTREHLLTASERNSEARLHLESLNHRLAASELGQPLTKEWVSNWNNNANTLIKQLLTTPTLPVSPVPPPVLTPPIVIPPPTAPTQPHGATLLDRTVLAHDSKAVDAFIAELKKAVARLGKGSFRIVVRREDDQ